ncbi:hypothetical protein [Geodermatophilus sp. Leaf369]|uniref:hypothetical protein n=1 Tax=Geodermatophilus sp. Leaf369 TaxID=1736354 RepID=UPI001910A0FA|nr:hypothetical protein [Geodermatophilus sp. Leaf369]
MAHSPHKQWKGCRVCRPHKDRRLGRSHRDPFRELRKLGTLSRVSRQDLGDVDLE